MGFRLIGLFNDIIRLGLFIESGGIQVVLVFVLKIEGYSFLGSCLKV